MCSTPSQTKLPSTEWESELESETRMESDLEEFDGLTRYPLQILIRSQYHILSVNCAVI